MLKLNAQRLTVGILLLSVLGLSACRQQDSSTAAVEIKAAPKLTNDATTYAHAAWEFVNEVDGLVYAKDVAKLESQVRQPARKLSTEWRIHVKMTDSVTEGKYALCRKALTSLDIWARTVIDSSSSATAKQADYERDKAQCQNAIAHPEYGNTDPKQKGNAINAAAS